MAIATVNLSYLGVGPTKSSQIVAQRNAAGKRILHGYATFTGDGSATSATLNWIDGTETLPFTPTAAHISRCGGTATATIAMGELEITDATSGVVNFASAPGNAATVKVCVTLFEG